MSTNTGLRRLLDAEARAEIFDLADRAEGAGLLVSLDPREVIALLDQLDAAEGLCRAALEGCPCTSSALTTRKRPAEPLAQGRWRAASEHRPPKDARPGVCFCGPIKETR